VDGKDVSDDAVLKSVLDEHGFDGGSLVARAGEATYKDELRQRTEEAIEHGVFGAPATFVDGELYWGQDRLWMVEKALEHGSGQAPRSVRKTEPAPASGRKLEFWYDFSSPFAYLGSTQVEALAERTGAELVWRPFLLGALFKKIGTADVPLSTFPAAKQRFYATDMNRHAVEYGVPFQFPSRFPARTVTALRAAICAGDQIGRVTRAIFHAYWAEDRDIGDNAELARVLAQAGLDPKLVDRAAEQTAKDELFRATDEAVERGMCGAPSYVVGDLVFWGQDRSVLVEKALGGFASP
jgi:2-hydroxychromene-2-carboxylate isomerase